MSGEVLRCSFGATRLYLHFGFFCIIVRRNWCRSRGAVAQNLGTYIVELWLSLCLSLKMIGMSYCRANKKHGLLMHLQLYEPTDAQLQSNSTGLGEALPQLEAVLQKISKGVWGALHLASKKNAWSQNQIEGRNITCCCQTILISLFPEEWDWESV